MPRRSGWPHASRGKPWRPSIAGGGDCGRCRDAGATALHRQRSEPLLPQIIARIAPARRNYLAMGSGFYEGGAGDGVPQVPPGSWRLSPRPGTSRRGGHRSLRKPGGCQAVAGAMAAIAEAGWNVRKPDRDRYGGHASCTPSSVRRAVRRTLAPLPGRLALLGSGNLTHPGLLRAGPSGGNLEAGIVLAPRASSGRMAPTACRVKAALPISWDEEPCWRPRTWIRAARCPSGRRLTASHRCPI